MDSATDALLRTDFFVTTALRRLPGLDERARAVAAELDAPFVPRKGLGMPRLFAERPDAARAMIVQLDRLLLVSRDGEELFYHPNMAFLRLGNLLRGHRDLLIDAARIGPGDSVLDCTLGYAAEAILCAHAVGESGEVHGVERVPELGVLVREGLRTVETDSRPLNEAMRRVRVVHLGHHLDYLRAAPSARYDVVTFDPFFPEMLEESRAIAPLRAFGSHDPLLPEAVDEARRVARRRVVVKSERWSDLLPRLGIAERLESRNGKIVYGVVPAD